MGSAPRTGRSVPSSESSPMMAVPARDSAGILPMQAIIVSAMGRSKAGPSFFRSAGARLTVMRWSGNPMPLFFSAARTRSRDSLTAASGRPTTSNEGMPKDRFTSTAT